MDTLRATIPDVSGDLVKNDFGKFLSTFNFANSSPEEESILSDYASQIELLARTNKSTLFVDFQHLAEYDYELAEAIEMQYYRFEPYLRAALKEILAHTHPSLIFNNSSEGPQQREYFIAFYNQTRVEKIRSMRSEKIGKLVTFSGTVTRSSEVKPELLYGTFLCHKCGTMNNSVEQHFQFTPPYVCMNSTCPSNDFLLLTDQCTYVDWQRLRVQENADEIPAGSMPRCIDVICRNDVVESAKAGDKITFTGSVVVLTDTSGLARVGETTTSGKTGGRGDNGDGVGGLKKLGVKEMTYRMIFYACNIVQTDKTTTLREQIETLMGLHEAELNESGQLIEGIEVSETDRLEIYQMMNTPHLYSKMAESICPSVFGHNEVKRGILLMLFGGVHKQTAEGISLRGDINVCIVGDPSCAKSQFLKYVHGFLPHTVYTSGKSSSAAGLTASVVRDHETGEHCIEAGALMLADNGICCIDEFDKMDPADQVAIHEAMEQQTISITKAGIQATLNARTSILAAANPVFGRYDRTKTLKANVIISPAIMSRFDLFFVILDECNPDIDELIARHIINNHSEAVAQVKSTTPFTMEQLQKYIKYGKTINPVITKESRRVFVECYRLLRQNDILGKNKTAYRITVRQLESLIRLSESLARLHMSPQIIPAYVREAYRLLQKSIIFVENEDIELEENEEEMEYIQRQNVGLRGDINDENDDNDDSDDRNSNGGNGPDDNNAGSQGGQERDREDDILSEGNKKDRGSEPKSVKSLLAKRSHVDSEGEVISEHVATTLAKQAFTYGEVDTLAGVNAEGKASAPTSGTTQDHKPQPAKRAKTQISAKEYETITSMIGIYLKRREGVHGGEASCTWGDAVQWYLQEVEAELVNLEAFETKKKIVNQVIRRMIKHDGTLMLVDDSLASTDKPNEEKLIQLHPSYEP